MGLLCEKENKENNKVYFIDSHAHLSMRQFENDRHAIIQSARKAEVGKILTVALDLQEAKQVLLLCQKNQDLLVAALGFHPHDAQKVRDGFYNEMADILTSHAAFVALGEIGLDYYRNLSPAEVQKKIFRKQLQLAKELNLPVLIHCRDAYEDTLKIMKEEKIDRIGGVMHCFSGDEAFAKNCLDLNFYLSFAGPLTYRKNERLRKVVGITPFDRLLAETDCPFLAPEPHRGKRNEPALVVGIFEEIAKIKGVELAEAAGKIMNNFSKIFFLV